MAKQQGGLPTAIDKRNMLHAPDPRKPFDPVQVGEEFERLGRRTEALDFFERIADERARLERIERVKKVAIECGDAFIVSRIAIRNLAPVSKDDWKAVATRAKDAGMLRHALRAAIQAGDEVLAQEIRATLGDAVPAALAAQAESPEQAKAGATTPGHKVEAVAAVGAAQAHEPASVKPEGAGNGDGAKA